MVLLVFLSLLTGTALQTLPPPAFVEGTRVVLPTGRAVYLSGEWRMKPAMWPDAALLYREQLRDLMIWAGGEREPRRLHEYPHRSSTWFDAPTWSADGRQLFLWFDIDDQLIALDVDSGRRTSLTQLPRHVWNYKSDEHLDPSPVQRRPAVIHDAARDRLLFMLHEESNDEVAPWQQKDGRGGYSLVAVDLTNHSMTTLAAKGAVPGIVLSWDLAVSRDRLYVVRPADERPIMERDKEAPMKLEERCLDGSLVRDLPQPDRGAEAIHLSPDEQWLLVERRFKPSARLPDKPNDAYRFADYQALAAASHGGFILVNTDSGETREGPDRGCEAAWSPDGSRILLADGWDLLLVDSQTLDPTPLLIAAQFGEGFTTWFEPIWSADGRRLALSGYDGNYGYFLLLLDLERREVILRSGEITSKAWIPIPVPFGIKGAIR